MSHRFLALLFLISGLVILAVMTRNGDLLLIAAPLLAYLGAAILKFPAEARLQARRSFQNSKPFTDQPVEVNVDLENSGPATLHLYLSDPLSPGMQVLSGSHETRISLPPGESASLRYTFQPRRGEYSWETLGVIASDPLGLIETHYDVPAPGRVITYPEIKRLKQVHLKPRRMLQTTGPYLSGAGGAGTDFFGVREFRPGDPMSQVHWRLAARHPGSFFTREMEREEIADIGLILDARTVNEISDGREPLFEHAIRATASLARLFLRQGNRVGMLIFGSGITCVYPGSGKGQLRKILRNLSSAAIGSNPSLNLFNYLPVRMFPGQSTIVVISPVGLRDLGAFKRLRANGYQVLLVSPDPVSYGLERDRSDREYILAARLARLERQVQLSSLRQLGIQVVDWQVEEPLQRAIHTALRRRRTRG